MNDELVRLRADIGRVLRESGKRGVVAWLLEVASWAQIAYRLLRWWRRSPIDIAPLRYFLEKVVESITHIHLPSRVDIGGGLRIYHGYGAIINGNARIGGNVTIYARVTIGERFAGDSCPLIGDNCLLGTGASVLGPVTVGAGQRVGAGTVVVYMKERKL